MEKVFAIFDSDTKYATRFMEFFQKRKDFDFEISAFTRKDSLEDFLKQHKIEILLLGDGLLEEEVPKDNIKYIYEISEHPGRTKDRGYPSIFKFQTAQELMSEVMLDYKGKESETTVSYGSGKFGIISVFTPLPNAVKSIFAWSLAMILSEKKKVLFLPLEALPVPILSIEGESNQGLSEFIYYLKENNPNMISKMKSLLCNIGNLSYLSGLTHGLDLFSISKEDICNWVEELKNHSDYDTVVFYLSFYSDAVVEIINHSETVLIAIAEKAYEKAVIKEWERQMEFIGFYVKQDKFHKFLVSEDDWTSGKTLTTQELQKSVVWSGAMQIAKDL